MIKPCVICGAPVSATGNHRTCGPACKRALRLSNLAKRQMVNPPKCAVCGAVVSKQHGSKFCREHAPRLRSMGFDHYIRKVETGCWAWTGGASGLNRSVGGKQVKAHHWTWTQRHGPIPEGKIVRPGYACGMGWRCVNPDHAVLGVPGDPVRDIENYGELSGTAKLTAEEVAEIRSSYATGNTTMKALAEHYRVSYTEVWRIVRQRRWTDPRIWEEQLTVGGDNNAVD